MDHIIYRDYIANWRSFIIYCSLASAVETVTPAMGSAATADAVVDSSTNGASPQSPESDGYLLLHPAEALGASTLDSCNRLSGREE